MAFLDLVGEVAVEWTQDGLLLFLFPSPCLGLAGYLMPRRPSR